MILEHDLKEFLEALQKAEVRFLVVGGYAVILHGYGRFTMDIDLWVDRTSENYARILKAFQFFGMPLFGMDRETFLNKPEIDVFTFGRPPCAIDLMVVVKGLSFEDAWNSKVLLPLDCLEVPVLDREHLFRAKRAAGRTKDRLDIEELGGTWEN
jgi:hypothetical protein